MKEKRSLLKMEFCLIMTIKLTKTNYFEHNMKLNFILEMVGNKRPFQEYKLIVSE